MGRANTMRIALVFPCGHFSSTPCLISIVKLLANNGVMVDIYTVINSSSKIGELLPFSKKCGVKLFFYPVALNSYKENIRKLLPGFTLWYYKKSRNLFPISQHRYHYYIYIYFFLRSHRIR